MINFFISVTSHAPDPPPPVTNCHTFSNPSPSSVTYFMDGPRLPYSRSICLMHRSCTCFKHWKVKVNNVSLFWGNRHPDRGKLSALVGHIKIAHMTDKCTASTYNLRIGVILQGEFPISALWWIKIIALKGQPTHCLLQGFLPCLMSSSLFLSVGFKLCTYS